MENTALVTGASGGIGREIARVHAERGGDLIVVARSPEALRDLKQELEEAHGVTVVVFEKDLSLPDAPREIFETVEEKGIEVNILVNNAGFGDLAPYYRSNWEKQAAMIAVNVSALSGLTNLFLPGMVERGRGKILNVASTAAFYPGPFMSVYYASKNYVLPFSAALAEELRGSGITVTTLCPGPTETGFQERAGNENTMLMKRLALMSPRRVAEYGYRMMERGKLVAVPGFINKVSAVIPRFLPRRAALRFVRKQHEEE